MAPAVESVWVVLKFGGTSVSTPSNWRNIAGVIRQRLSDGSRVMVVHSALSGITDRLERLLAAALGGEQEPALRIIEERHCELAAQLGVEVSPELENYFAVLRQMAAGIS